MERVWVCTHILILFVCRLSTVLAQDYGIYGLYEHAAIEIKTRKQKEIYSTCFEGFQFTSCVPNLVDDDVVLSYDLEYYRNLASMKGQFYCVQCCGTPPDDIDIWDLSCTMDAMSLSKLSSEFGYELRLARKKTLTDTTVIRCPFTRSQCDFSVDFAPVCDRTKDTHIHGYTLTIEVEQLDSNFQYWRGVRSCAFSDIDERDYPLTEGETFHEKIILKHSPVDTFSTSDLGKVMIIVACCVAGVYVALYFFRRKRCEYCQGKLVFSRRLCYKCVCVGAQPPDPVLLKALEERGEAMQGKLPVRLGFIQQCCVGACQGIYRSLTCQCCCRPCAWFCRTCCWCCKCCHCCEPKPPERIVPDNIDAMTIEELTALEKAILMERGMDPVEVFEIGPESAVTTHQPSGVKSSQSSVSSAHSGKSRAHRINDATYAEVKPVEKKKKRKPSITTTPAPPVEAQAASESNTKKKKNPNILDYPKDVIYKAVKHPAVY